MPSWCPSLRAQKRRFGRRACGTPERPRRAWTDATRAAPPERGAVRAPPFREAVPRPEESPLELHALRARGLPGLAARLVRAAYERAEDRGDVARDVVVPLAAV